LVVIVIISKLVQALDTSLTGHIQDPLGHSQNFLSSRFLWI